MLKSTIEQVREFHDVFQPGTAKNRYVNLPEDRIQLRIKLIQEELNELEEALYKRNTVEVLDALCDLQYVLDGTFIECGMASIKDEAFAEVHRSNMSKADEVWIDAQDSIEHHRTQGVICSSRRSNNKYVILRDDGKVLKSRNYSPPKLEEILVKQL